MAKRRNLWMFIQGMYYMKYRIYLQLYVIPFCQINSFALSDKPRRLALSDITSGLPHMEINYSKDTIFKRGCEMSINFAPYHREGCLLYVPLIEDTKVHHKYCIVNLAPKLMQTKTGSSCECATSIKDINKCRFKIYTFGRNFQYIFGQDN